MSGWASAITAAIGSMTPAQQVLYSGRMGTATRKRRKKTAAKRGKKKATAKRAKRAKRSGAKRAYMVKGSPAAKRRMAQLRRLRGKRRK